MPRAGSAIFEATLQPDTVDRQALQERFGILGDSPALRRVLDRIRQVGPADIAVLLEGESGVGKELIATAIHGISKRRQKRLVVVNCGAIPEGLIESELFGAERGAYTGSVERRTGYFEEADGGTIFLDEIGEMPLQAQVRLLRVLESGQYSRVGSSTLQKTDARVIAATNKNLGTEVQAGRFREDLYYRLSTVVLRVPPLRDRRDDIVPLFETFLEGFARQYDASFLRLAPDARALLQQYSWPGNVRELRNVAEQTVVLIRQGPVTAEALRPYLRGVSAARGLTLARPAGGDEVRERELLYRALLELRAEMREIRGLLRHAVTGDAGGGLPDLAPTDGAFAGSLAPAGLPAGGESPFSVAPLAAPLGETAFREPEHEVAYEPPVPQDAYDAADTPFEIESTPETFADVLADGLPLPTMEDAETALIREALRRFDGNRRQTADALGISERTLYRKIKDIEGAE